MKVNESPMRPASEFMARPMTKKKVDDEQKRIDAIRWVDEVIAPKVEKNPEDGSLYIEDKDAYLNGYFPYAEEYLHSLGYDAWGEPESTKTYFYVGWDMKL